MQSMVISKKQWFLIGVTTGVILSMFVMPLIEDCHYWDQITNDYNTSNWYSFIANNDFNPVVRLNHNISQTNFDAKHITQRVFRPKYFSTELEVKENLLICVYLSPNDNNVYNSDSFILNQTIEEFSDKVMHFYEESLFNSPKHILSDTIVLKPESNGMPFIKSKPKYLNILKYLFNARIVQNFNFIFIISDKTFVNRNNLNQFLDNHSVSQHIFASPFITFNNNNINNNNNNELNNLITNPNDSLESGVILSTSLLLKCNLDLNCLNQFRNSFLNANKNSLFSYKLNFKNYEEFDEKNADFKSIYESLTVFPVLHIKTYQKLNLILCQKSINDSMSKLQSIEEQIITSNLNESGIEWPIGVEPPLRANNRFEVIRWSYFNESHSLMPNDFDVSLPLNAIEAIELSQIKYECFEWLRKKYEKISSEENFKILNIYRRFDAIRGLEYIIDFRLRSFAELKRLQVIKPFNRIEMIPGVPYVTENVKIILILTIRSPEEVESASSFLSQYTNLCLKKSSHRTVLILVLIYKPNYKSDEYIKIKSEATQLQTKYKNSGAKIAWIPIISAKNEKVPTEVAYFDMITKKLSPTFSDALLLQCRPNQILSLDYLNRVRLNTIQSNQVFFPIPFVEYRLRSQVKTYKTFDVRKDSGYFETTNYNHFSFYLSDYLKVRKNTQQILAIVRNEQFLKRDTYYGSDIDIYHLFLEYNKYCDKNANLSKKLFIMRAIEPELRLKYESFANIDCQQIEGNRYAVHNCQQRTVFGLGTRPQLAALVINNDKKDKQELTDDQSDQNVDF